MSLNDDKETERRKPAASTKDDETSIFPTPTLDPLPMIGDTETPGRAQNDRLIPQQEPATAVLEELQALKLKLAKLEGQCRLQSEEFPTKSTPRELDPDAEEYKRLEACLYGHRKDWENNVGPGAFLGLDPSHSKRHSLFPYGPWCLQWRPDQERQYSRPDPFNSSHKCGNASEVPRERPLDDYDRTIDYGGRRDRLRKHFEWEMDRLYLSEELDRRRHEKEEKSSEIKVQTTRNKTTNLPQHLGEPISERLDWSRFKNTTAMENTDACVIQILVGEPVVDDDLTNDYKFLFGYSRLQDSKAEKTHTQRAEGEHSQLPERIRIHSDILIKILYTILEPNIEPSASPIVLVRPFKALVYAEKALRDWCTALKEKFTPRVEPEEMTREDVGSLPGKSQEYDISTSQPGPEKSVESNRPEVPEKTNQEAITKGKEHEGSGNTEESSNGKLNLQQDEDSKANDSVEETKSPAALKHLMCFLSFMDFDISPRQTSIKANLLTKILFSELWHLFRPGMEVIDSDGKQAYRVIGVTGAKHRVDSTQDLWYNPWISKSKEGNNLDSGQKKNKKAPFSVTCVYIDFDGRNIGPVTRVFHFRRFNGEKTISSLEIYPLQLHDLRPSELTGQDKTNSGNVPATITLREKLICRGMKFLDVATVKHMYYSGPSLGNTEEIESQVVVDFETALSTDEGMKPKLKNLVGAGNPLADDDVDESESDDDDDCQGSCCINEKVYDDSYVDSKQASEYINSLLPKQGLSDQQPSIAAIPRPLEELRTGSRNNPTASDDELVIMSYRVFGFVLRSRKWAELDVSYLSEAHSPKKMGNDEESSAGNRTERPKPATPFDHLVLEKGHREIILSLIAQHFRDKKLTEGQTEGFDIVRGKGKGLILLLHGAPGVGKTSTAEGVAELFQKPLFQITCGDLGTTAPEVEASLERNFAMANKWGCVLLLDEADVFLAERTKEDFTRNGLVAVFLRVMEYYAGILFLTTNRVGDFDEAFTSRIHVSLYYPELDGDKTVEIFKINMAMIEDRFAKKGRLIEVDKVGIGGFAAQHFVDHPLSRWNGRQIRNACQTALALAEFESQGNNHEDVLKPDAKVNLGVRHFEIVRNAYLEFTTYMNSLYGTDSAHRAKESRIRAKLTDWKNVTDGGSMSSPPRDKKADFFLSSQSSSSGRQRPPQAPVPHQGFQQPDDYTPSTLNRSHSNWQAPYHAYGPRNPPQMQSTYPGPGYTQVAAQHQPQGQFRDPPMERVMNPTTFEGSMQGYGQTLISSQPAASFQSQQEHPPQATSNWPDPNIQAMYAAQSSQNFGKE